MPDKASTCAFAACMDLDVNTLFMVTMHVEIMLGLLLFFAWAQNFSKRALAWWGSAHLMRAVSIMLLGLHGIGARLAFDRFRQCGAVRLVRADLVRRAGVRPPQARSRRWRWSASRSGCSPAACRRSCRRRELRALLGSGIVTTYIWLTAYEFWRGRDEALVSRWPAIFMLFAHGALFLLRTPLGSQMPCRSRQQSRDERLARAAQPRGAAVHHLDRLHPACHGEGAHRISPPRRGAHRSAHRHRQPPRLPRADRGVPTRRDRRPADRGAAVRSRPFQVDQRPLRPRRRRPHAADFRRHRQGAYRRSRAWSDAGAATSSSPCSTTPAARSRRPWPSASSSPSRRPAADIDGRLVGATVSTGMAFSPQGPFELPALAAAGRPGALSRQRETAATGFRSSCLRSHRTANSRPATT